MKGTAVITGASSGIGAIYSERLADRGYDVILIARRADQLDRVAERIRSRTGRKVDVFVADLTDELDVARVETLLKSDAGITLLVNNAGLGGAGTLLQSDVDKMTSMIALNVTALTRLTYALVPKLVARGAGAIINISSVVAITPETLNGVYGGTKAFVLAFSQNLHKELEETGVTVQVVLPGATRTDFWAVRMYSPATACLKAPQCSPWRRSCRRMWPGIRSNKWIFAPGPAWRLRSSTFACSILVATTCLVTEKHAAKSSSARHGWQGNMSVIPRHPIDYGPADTCIPMLSA